MKGKIGEKAMKLLGTKILHTERLTLRPFRESDAEAMFANWANDPEVTKYMTWTPHGDVSVTRALCQKWEQEAAITFQWAIEYEGELVGSISVVGVDEVQERGTIGYCMGKKWWGKGLMTEAAREILRFMFEEVGIFCISGTHAAPNVGSGRVMEKNGLQYEGTRRKHWKLPNTGERVDIVMRGMTQGDYFAQK